MGVLVPSVGCCPKPVGASGEDGQGAGHARIEQSFAGARGCELGNRLALLVGPMPCGLSCEDDAGLGVRRCWNWALQAWCVWD